MGRDSWRDERSEGRIILARMISLVVESLLVVHLLHVAVRVAVHLDTIRRGRDTMVRAVHVLVGLGKRRGASLAVLAHAIVEEAGAGLGNGIVVIVGKLRGELVVEIDVDGVGQVGERRGRALGVVALCVGEVAEIVQIKVD